MLTVEERNELVANSEKYRYEREHAFDSPEKREVLHMILSGTDEIGSTQWLGKDVRILMTDEEGTDACSLLLVLTVGKPTIIVDRGILDDLVDEYDGHDLHRILQVGVAHELRHLSQVNEGIYDITELCEADADTVAAADLGMTVDDIRLTLEAFYYGFNRFHVSEVGEDDALWKLFRDRIDIVTERLPMEEAHPENIPVYDEVVRIILENYYKEKKAS